jgi:hypothetical protein
MDVTDGLTLYGYHRPKKKVLNEAQIELEKKTIENDKLQKDIRMKENRMTEMQNELLQEKHN